MRVTKRIYHQGQISPMASLTPTPLQNPTDLPPTAVGQPILAVTTAEQKWALLERIVQSKGFQKSQRLTDFLLYICRKAIDGRTTELNEQDIGEHVFERREGFDPGLDNIVRVTARRVRQKLDEYYAGEGQEEPLILSMPVGGYIPRFETRQPLAFESVAIEAAVVAEPKPPVTHVASAPMIRAGQTYAFGKLAMAIALLLLVASAGLIWRLRLHDAPLNLPANAMWSTLLNGGRRSIFVPGDSALVLFENHTHHPVALGDYISKRYLVQIPQGSVPNPGVEREEAERPYNSVVDVRFAAQLARLPEAQKAMDIVLARDLSMEDLKESNVVLSGAREANPWVQMFQDGLDYLIIDRQQGDNYIVVNHHPANGEPSAYSYKSDDPAHVAYAIVAYVPNLSGQGRVLLVQGTTMAGTEAAMDFVLDRDRLNKLLGPHMQHRQVPPFQVLLETTNINGSSPQSRILSYRFH
jgi:hypothetical protein